jgi:spore germination protein YaaH
MSVGARLAARAVLVGTCLSAGAFALAATASLASVAPASGGLRAFVLASSSDSFADLQAHAAAVGVAYPTYYECSSSGSRVLGEDDPGVSEWIAAHGIVLVPRYTCQDGAQVHRLLRDRSLRGKLLRQLVGLVEAHPLYRGLSIDLENDGAEDRARLTSFVAEAAARLHALGRRLSVVVDGVRSEDPRRATYLYDERALGALADEVFVMAWGAHWEGSAPGPIAPLSWVRQVARFVASLPYARRFVLGVAMYGLDWRVRQAAKGGVRAVGHGVAGQYASIAALAAQVGARPRRDPRSGELTFDYASANGVRHQVWYADARAVAASLRAGRDAGLHVGVWRLGSEDQALWSALL